MTTKICANGPSPSLSLEALLPMVTFTALWLATLLLLTLIGMAELRRHPHSNGPVTSASDTPRELGLIAAGFAALLVLTVIYGLLVLTEQPASFAPIVWGAAAWLLTAIVAAPLIWRRLRREADSCHPGLDRRSRLTSHVFDTSAPTSRRNR